MKTISCQTTSFNAIIVLAILTNITISRLNLAKKPTKQATEANTTTPGQGRAPVQRNARGVESVTASIVEGATGSMMFVLLAQVPLILLNLITFMANAEDYNNFQSCGKPETYKS